MMNLYRVIVESEESEKYFRDTQFRQLYVQDNSGKFHFCNEKKIKLVQINEKEIMNRHEFA